MYNRKINGDKMGKTEIKTNDDQGKIDCGACKEAGHGSCFIKNLLNNNPGKTLKSVSLFVFCRGMMKKR